MQTTGRPNPSPSGAARRLGAGLRLNAAMSIVAAAGLFGIVALTQVAPKSSSPPVTATPSLYDGDGVPHTITGEPVLRGAAIITRAAAGGGTPFLVAGWHTTDPQPTCVPNAIRCGYTSLVDAPGSHSSGLVTLDRPAGQQFSFNVAEAWAGGFYVLRVRAGCAMGAGTCLVVEEIIGPQAALPIDATGFDADGLPRTVDGQPVARGSDIASRLQLGRDTQPVYVAGLPEAATPTGASPCTDPVTWDQHPCPAVHLADPARGLPFGQAAPLLQVDPWIGESAWQPTATWPGGYVVIRAGGSAILGVVPPPGFLAAATAEPMPSLDFSAMAYNARVIEIEGRTVRWGTAIASYLATSPATTFLVTGAAQRRACATCSGGFLTILGDPPVKGAKASDREFVLLRGDGSPFIVGPRMVWASPPGIVVLEVRPFTGTCPSGVSCAAALEVVRVVVPPIP